MLLFLRRLVLLLCGARILLLLLLCARILLLLLAWLGGCSRSTAGAVALYCSEP